MAGAATVFRTAIQRVAKPVTLLHSFSLLPAGFLLLLKIAISIFLPRQTLTKTNASLQKNYAQFIVLSFYVCLFRQLSIFTRHTKESGCLPNRFNSLVVGELSGTIQNVPLSKECPNISPVIHFRPLFESGYPSKGVLMWIHRGLSF